MPLKYSEAFKKAVIQRYEHGTLIPVLCNEFGIALSTFYRWRRSTALSLPTRECTPLRNMMQCPNT